MLFDTTPPVITPNVAGTLGQNGWYVSNVAATWTVSDPESTPTTTGCETQNITADTAGSGANRTMSVTAAPKKSGTAVLTIEVSDGSTPRRSW